MNGRVGYLGNSNDDGSLSQIKTEGSYDKLQTS